MDNTHRQKETKSEKPVSIYYGLQILWRLIKMKKYGYYLIFLQLRFNFLKNIYFRFFETIFPTFSFFYFCRESLKTCTTFALVIANNLIELISQKVKTIKVLQSSNWKYNKSKLYEISESSSRDILNF